MILLFSFFTQHQFDPRSVDIDPTHFSTGVYPGNDIHEPPLFRAEKILSGDEFAAKDRDWGDLQVLGFPFRAHKETAAGVIKDQWSPEPYVTLSLERDVTRMSTVRKQYRAMGEVAVRELELGQP